MVTGMKTDLTHARLCERLRYEPDTGSFTWLLPPRTARVGSVAGGLIDRGYWRISVDDTRYLAHRLAWLYVTGAWPADQLDHINGDRADNRLANLRPADNSLNHANKGPAKNNTSGVKGVSWDRRRKRWHAYIKVRGQRRSLGFYADLAVAAASYAAAAQRSFGSFAKVN